MGKCLACRAAEGACGFTLVLAACGRSRAEDGSAAWLRYAPIANPGRYSALPLAHCCAWRKRLLIRLRV